MTTSPHQIIIADSQYLATASLSLLIEQTPGYLFKGKTDHVYGLKDILKKNPETRLLVTDFFLVDFKGFDDLAKILASHPELKVLILTHSVKHSDVSEFKKIGIKNILYKTAGREEILQAMQYTLKDKKFYSDEIVDMLIEGNASRQEMLTSSHLTPAEIEITKLIASGMTTRKIADQKHKSFHTIMAHRKNIFRKLNINSTSELVMYAIKAGLIDNIEYYI